MNRAIPNQTDRGDWALGSWELGPTRDRAVRPGMPGLALPETLPGTGMAAGGGNGLERNGSGRAGKGRNS